MREAGHFARDRKKVMTSDQNSSMNAENARQARGITAADSPADVCAIKIKRHAYLCTFGYWNYWMHE